MCIPIDLDVPVLSSDGVELGTAREILCSCAHGDEQASPEPTPIRRPSPPDDLWLHASRPLGLDLYIPFSVIVETRSDGVRVRATAERAEHGGWTAVPDGLSTERAVAV